MQAEMIDAAAEALHKAISLRDPYTGRHNSRTERLSVLIGTQLQLPPPRLQGLQIGARLHDIGKLGIPGDLLAKPGRLSAIEMELVRQHPLFGYNIVKDLASPWPLSQIVRSHHERLDGSGYPDGLSGDAICLEARIVAVADAVDAMTSMRGYRPALPIPTVIAELHRDRGIRLDEAVVDICIDLLGQPDFLEL